MDIMQTAILAALLIPAAALSPYKSALYVVHRTSQRSTAMKAYGRGSTIWPECNEQPISLSASFPDGVLPQVAQDMIDSSLTSPSSAASYQPTTSTSTSEKRRVIKRTLKHLLQSAAAASSRRASSTADDGVFISKFPLVLATLLVTLNCVSVKHIYSLLGVTIYLIGMTCWCAYPKSNGESILPSASSQGHVPHLISNPLGSLSNSNLYRIYLRLGALISLLLPIIALSIIGVKDVYHGGLEGILLINLKDAFNSVVLARPMHGILKKLLGGHVFLVCCQVLSEGVGRASSAPLPIRILIPITYNTIRLSSLHDWVFYPTVVAGEYIMLTPLRILGVVNLVYWYANLMLFLPVAAIRYLRAYVYCVEAVEVTVRKGHEQSVGLL